MALEDDEQLQEEQTEPPESGQADESSPDLDPPRQESVDEPAVEAAGESESSPSAQPADPTPVAQEQAPDPLSDLEKEIEDLDTFDPDATKATMKKMLKVTAEATKSAAEANARADALDKYTQRGNSFSAAAKTYGVSRLEAETIFDQQVELLRKRGLSGEALANAATARWEVMLEMKKDQPAERAPQQQRQTVRPSTPVTRGGASTIPAGRAPTPVPVQKVKSFDDKVRDGEYFKFEEL